MMEKEKKIMIVTLMLVFTIASVSAYTMPQFLNVDLASYVFNTYNKAGLEKVYGMNNETIGARKKFVIESINVVDGQVVNINLTKDLFVSKDEWNLCKSRYNYTYCFNEYKTQFNNEKTYQTEQERKRLIILQEQELANQMYGDDVFIDLQALT